MYTQTQGPCGDCRGQGNTMNEKDKCKLCKGDKVIDNDKILEIPVEQGVMDGKKYVFSGEGDEYPEV